MFFLKTTQPALFTTPPTNHLLHAYALIFVPRPKLFATDSQSSKTIEGSVRSGTAWHLRGNLCQKMALNNVSASLVSATNENSLALASMKLDISMIKVEVPAEYTGLNAALTSKRRTAAEEGSAHKTARRLGIIFQDLIPSTPELLRAYGRRSSDICQKSASKGTERNITSGIFANFLGADVTSIWAAATSGASSISAHLLACLLARMWSPSEATSIWVEIVAERKRQIKEQSDDGVYKTSLELQLVCRDEISRKDLAEWDAGARAWLQIADEAQMRRQKQLMLIIKNIHLPVNTEGSTYDRVLDAWITTLKAMERLICGQPQRVGKGAALIGIASWHLYPNLLVLGESMKPVRFKDDLVSELGQLTIGLDNTNQSHCDGVFWSLPLSQLRFYGDPVMAVSNTRDALRLSMDELELVVFGSAISNWGSHYLDVLGIARFFQLLHKKVELDDSRTDGPRGWLQPLWSASRTLLSLTGDDLKNALATVALGRRNGRDFLGNKASHPPPYFGMCHPFLSGLLRQPWRYIDRQEVERLRFIAMKLCLRPEEAIIRVLSSKVEGLNSPTPGEYLTAVPHTRCTFESLGPKHGRWAFPLPQSSGQYWRSPLELPENNCICHAMGHSCHKNRCSCIKGGTTCNPKCHTSFTQSEDGCIGCTQQTNDPERLASPSSRPHGCGNLPRDEFIIRMFVDLFTPVEADFFLRNQLHDTDRTRGAKLRVGLSYRDHLSLPSIIRGIDQPHGGLCECYSPSTVPVFQAIAGNPERVALFVRTDDRLHDIRGRLKREIKDLKQNRYYEWAEEQDKVPDETLMETMDGTTLRYFLWHISNSGLVTLPQLNIELQEAKFDFRQYMRSLEAFQMARNVYKSLTGATASLRVIDRPLNTARWVPVPVNREINLSNLSRARRFACIAFFESGVYDLDPVDFTEVIAISTRNSLYVSTVLLGDPFGVEDMNDVHHVIGNVGKTGMIMMVAPLAPKVRSVDLNRWQQVAHSRFTGETGDSFKATSLLLSFTEFEMPFDIGQRGSIDRDMHVRIVETIISVYDRGDWVADLDILLLYEPVIRGHEFIRRLEAQSAIKPCKISVHGHERRRPLPLTSIDNWEELLNLPDDIGVGHVGVIRAHDNWLARVATACVAAQRGFRTVILPARDICWECCSCRDWRWKVTRAGDKEGRASGQKEPGTQGRQSPEESSSRIEDRSTTSWLKWQSRNRWGSDTEMWDDSDDSDDSANSQGSDITLRGLGGGDTVATDDELVAPPHVFIS